VRWTAVLVLVTAGTGLLAESLGTSTGFPFGSYEYADSLGWKLLSVPVVIPLAWAMMAYPCLLVGQRLASTRLGAAVVGGAALASWDLFLDPQMVEAGHWTWSDVQLALPGSPGIPVSNYLGWLLVAVLMVGVLQLLPPARGRRPGAGSAVPLDVRVVGAGERRVLRPAAVALLGRDRHGPGRRAVRAVQRAPMRLLARRTPRCVIVCKDDPSNRLVGTIRRPQKKSGA
jgi:hypothetical protein